MTTKSTTTSQSSKASKARPKSKQAATEKSKLSEKERVKRLYKSLCAQIDDAHFTNALKTCDKGAFPELVSLK